MRDSQLERMARVSNLRRKEERHGIAMEEIAWSQLIKIMGRFARDGI